jgi:hypothetical protein
MKICNINFEFIVQFLVCIMLKKIYYVVLLNSTPLNLIFDSVSYPVEFSDLCQNHGNNSCLP